MLLRMNRSHPRASQLVIVGLGFSLMAMRFQSSNVSLALARFILFILRHPVILSINRRLTARFPECGFRGSASP
jgi:predicted Kef-type K+ transport protein